jgi:hypothetical protein
VGDAIGANFDQRLLNVLLNAWVEDCHREQVGA